MIQQIIIGIVFLAAVGYLFTVVRAQFRPGRGVCAKGCGTCTPSDVEKTTGQPSETAARR